MILRHLIAQSLPSNLFSLLLLLSSTVYVTAEDFDCHVTTEGLTWDLTQLKGVQTLSRTRESPPTTMLDELRFSLCDDLPTLEDVAEGDQCFSGTRACLRTKNQKEGYDDRVIAVIPVAQSSSLGPEYKSLTSPKGLSLTFHGASYPSNDPIPQSIQFSLLCADTTDPTFVAYENGTVHVEWSTPSGCSTAEQSPPQEDDKTGDGGSSDSDEKPTESVGSGLGFFFIVLLLAFAAYFGLGAYYNYSTYGARGVDLIPHRDFWREVPYMLQDVVSHLCSTVRPRRSSRGGYIAV
ncbi:putative autophagy protein Atg27 [Suillus paluster]|uniref:putative autophagy protein Atg27 n=1 Tax=Suillus paluster TaxID=48578 RepID=UPI001B8868B6|nr:putative autophagy protein Atg27 [Suillus paluster]KAG1751570.1 putative autophagy protein Atg27 [Suillus paluster]